MTTIFQIWDTPESELVRLYGDKTKLRGDDLRIVVTEDYYNNNLLSKRSMQEFENALWQEKLNKVKMNRTLDFVYRIRTFGELLSLSLGTNEGVYLPIFYDYFNIPSGSVDIFNELSRYVFVDSFIQRDNYSSLTFWINPARLIYIKESLMYSESFDTVMKDKTGTIGNNLLPNFNDNLLPSFDELASFVRSEYVEKDPNLPYLKHQLFKNLTICMIYTTNNLISLEICLLDILETLND